MRLPLAWMTTAALSTVVGVGFAVTKVPPVVKAKLDEQLIIGTLSSQQAAQSPAGALEVLKSTHRLCLNTAPHRSSLATLCANVEAALKAKQQEQRQQQTNAWQHNITVRDQDDIIPLNR